MAKKVTNKNSYNSYLNKSSKATQQERSDPRQVLNNAGGYTFKAKDWERLDRFLILGSDAGTYYLTPQALTEQNADVVLRCFYSNTSRTLNRIAEISSQGRAPKNEPALFALALIVSHKLQYDSEVYIQARREASSVILRAVARTGTDIIHFCQYVKQFRSFGRSLRRGVSSWFLENNVRDIEYNAVKYQSRDGWSLSDVMRLARPAPISEEQSATFKWIVDGWGDDWSYDFDKKLFIGTIGNTIKLNDVSHDAHRKVSRTFGAGFDRIYGFERIKGAENAQAAADMIDKYNLPRECVPTKYLNDPVVWNALLRAKPYGMPMTALIRNLGKMSSIGILNDKDQLNFVVDKIANPDAVKQSRLHPINILTASCFYKMGSGVIGSLSWNVDRKIVEALEKAFYLSFGNIEPTGKRILYAVDSSGSMSSPVITGMTSKDAYISCPLSCREAGIAMAMATVRTEECCDVVGFTMGNFIYKFNVNPSSSLESIVLDFEKKIDGSGTDCSLPIRYALDNNLKYDAIVMATDGETWAGKEHVHTLLNEYRKKIGVKTKFITMHMASNSASLIDPDDINSMNFVGLDSSAPSIISNFISGK